MPLGELVLVEPDYGAPYRSIPREADQAKYIRVTDFGDFGIPEDHQFVAAERFEERYLLEDKDVLFARSGATAGKTYLYRESLGKAQFAGYCIRFKFDKDLIQPEFVYLYTKTKRYQAWVASIQRPSGQPNINKEEFKSFTVPLPELPVQARLVAELEAARSLRQEKLKQADALLTGMDNYVLSCLSIVLPLSANRQAVYAVRAKDVRSADKLYPDYFNPERLNTIAAVQAKYTGKNSTTLQDIADFIRDQQIVKPDDDYLGLANVQPNTGERVVSEEKDGKGTCFRYVKNDVLFARLRPYLNKVYRAESNGVCSTEYHVIRIHSDEKGHPILEPDYLAAVLRSRVVLLQTKHMMTGNTHPRLANEDVTKLVVPVPDKNAQTGIANEIARRRVEARLLRDAARSLWEAALQKFEDQLLQPGGAGGEK